MKKNIALTGANGFLGSSLKKKLENYYNIQTINLHSYEKINFFLEEIRNDKFKIVINCAASLSPKKEIDFFINSELPLQIQKIISKKKIKFIHISSINVIYSFLTDPYTVSKRKADEKLTAINTTILRPNLLIKDNYELSNNILDKYLKIKLPIHPFFFPGNTYSPLKISAFTDFILNEIKIDKKRIVNIYGKQSMTLYEIFAKLAKNKKRKILKVNLSFIENILPKNLKFILSKKQVLQQFFNFDRSKINNKKEINILI